VKEKKEEREEKKRRNGWTPGERLINSVISDDGECPAGNHFIHTKV
jgi:hypothetical protein